MTSTASRCDRILALIDDCLADLEDGRAAARQEPRPTTLDPLPGPARSGAGR